MGRVDHEDAFLIPMIWSVPEESLFFQNRQCFPGRIWDNSAGYTGACGFLCGDGATLQVLDYAVLVISGADGVQGHTETLWRLLGEYKIPVFLFL